MDDRGKRARRLTAFHGQERIAQGGVEEVLAAAKRRVDAGGRERIAIFDDEAGVLDIDFRGTLDEVLGRLDQHPLLRPETPPPAGRPGTGQKPGDGPRQGPGRPKLGVVAREVTLLPRHWDWLSQQRGGASAAIRRLVDDARKRGASGEQARKAQEASYRFMSDMTADLPGFEEASRSFFAGKYEAFFEITGGWPKDIRDHIESLVSRQRELEEVATGNRADPVG